MDKLETIEGVVEHRTPDTEVLMRKSHGGRKKVYHEIPNDYEPGDFPPCGAHNGTDNGFEYEVITLEEAIRKWAEPCGHVECSELRTGNVREYKNEDTLKEMFWNQGMTQKEIGEQFDVCRDAIRRQMDRQDVPTTKAGYREKYGEEPPQKSLRKVTEEEKEAIREEFDVLLINDSFATKIHLHDDGVPACIHAENTAVRLVSESEAPEHDICKYCGNWWRD